MDGGEPGWANRLTDAKCSRRSEAPDSESGPRPGADTGS